MSAIARNIPSTKALTFHNFTVLMGISEGRKNLRIALTVLSINKDIPFEFWIFILMPQITQIQQWLINCLDQGMLHLVFDER